MQNIIVLLLVITCVVVVVKRFTRMLRAAKGIGGCGCHSCSRDSDTLKQCACKPNNR